MHRGGDMGDLAQLQTNRQTPFLVRSSYSKRSTKQCSLITKHNTVVWLHELHSKTERQQECS